MQTPRVDVAPASVASTASADEACDLADMAGIRLEPWQSNVLRTWLGEEPDGTWSASSCGLVVARQNGKGMVTAVRELAGIIVFGEAKVIHSAHQFDTSMEHMQLVLDLIEQSKVLQRQYIGHTRAHGQEAIRFRTGQIRFKTRTKTGTRGFGGDLVVFDEAFDIPEAAFNSIRPTVTARPNHQILYTSTPVNQTEHFHGHVLARLRHRALHPGSAGRLAYAEWSIDEHAYRQQPRETAADPESWAQANPALGYGRITAQTLADALEEMSLAGFANEHLGVGDWPDVTADGEHGPVEPDQWRRLTDPTSPPAATVAFAADVAPDRHDSVIVAAGRRPDGRMLVEEIDRRPGRGWVADRLRQLAGRHDHVGVAVDGYADLDGDLDGIDGVHVVSATDLTSACGTFIETVRDGQLVHIGQDSLTADVLGGRTRKVGGGLAWVRTSDASALIAASMAVHVADRPQPAAQSWVIVR